MPVLTRCNEWSEGALLNRQEGILPLEIADFVVNVDDKWKCDGNIEVRQDIPVFIPSRIRYWREDVIWQISVAKVFQVKQLFARTSTCNEDEEIEVEESDRRGEIEEEIVEVENKEVGTEPEKKLLLRSKHASKGNRLTWLLLLLLLNAWLNRPERKLLSIKTVWIDERDWK